jgi:hypothetical protein
MNLLLDIFRFWIFVHENKFMNIHECFVSWIIHEHRNSWMFIISETSWMSNNKFIAPSWIIHECFMNELWILFMNVHHFCDIMNCPIISSLHLHELFLNNLWMNNEFYLWSIHEHSRIHGIHEHRISWTFIIIATSWIVQW